MSTSYGVWCLSCHTGYMTDLHYRRVLDGLLRKRLAVSRLVELLNELNTEPVLLVSLYCDEIGPFDFEHLTSFIAEHHMHALCVLDEYDDRWKQFYLSQQEDNYD